MQLKNKSLYGVFLLMVLCSGAQAQTGVKALFLDKPLNNTTNRFYPGNQKPLLGSYFIKLPLTAIKPGGWLRKNMELQRSGLTGHLGEISIWLSKMDNAWLSPDGKGKYGWEELPYWLKGYADIGYMLRDGKMIREARFWIEAVLRNQRENGDFGPVVEKKGKKDFWTNMPMIWCLQSYYEFTQDRRVLDFLSRYFKFELSVPDEDFLEDYWEKSRGGDNLVSVYWLYNYRKEPWLLDLATKIDRNTANWRQKNNLPNWHNVNVAECFREPATYFMQSGDNGDLEATYDNFTLIRDLFGQVPGGMFGADENARKGYSDPRQAVETCGMVEQMTSDQMLLRFTGDTRWAENCEDVAINSFSAAFMADYRSLRYLTAPNMVVSDSKNHAPGIANEGPFLMMNPFSSRCCQHNHAAGWVYYAENSWMATPDNGLAAQFYTQGEVKARVGNGKEVRIIETTRYPFEESVSFRVQTGEPLTFPLYLRLPAWCARPVVTVNGKCIAVSVHPGGYVQLMKKWKKGDHIELKMPMEIRIREWTQNKKSVSVNYGPLTFSLKIQERYVEKNSKETAIGDSRWQENADPAKWPSYEIYADNAWNYGLRLDPKQPENSFQVVRKPWPQGDDPFTNPHAPIELIAKGRQIPSWTIDQYGLCGVLPESPVNTTEPLTRLELIPMGGARLRISAFPVVQ